MGHQAIWGAETERNQPPHKQREDDRPKGFARGVADYWKSAQTQGRGEGRKLSRHLLWKRGKREGFENAQESEEQTFRVDWAGKVAVKFDSNWGGASARGWEQVDNFAEVMLPCLPQPDGLRCIEDLSRSRKDEQDIAKRLLSTKSSSLMAGVV